MSGHDPACTWAATSRRRAVAANISSMLSWRSVPITSVAGGATANAAAPPPQPTSSTEPPSPRASAARRFDSDRSKVPGSGAANISGVNTKGW